MDYLTVKEVAELKGCSERYVKKLAKDGKLESVQEMSCKGRPKYLIPVSALPENLQAKYYKQKKTESGILPDKVAPENVSENALKTPIKYGLKDDYKSFEELSEDERKQVQFWSELVKQWHSEREQHTNKTEFDKLFVAHQQYLHPELQLSETTLYRKWAAYQSGNYLALVDGRGGHSKGSCSIPQPVWDAFLWYYLDDRRPTYTLCYHTTVAWTKEFYPELLDLIPSQRTFQRHVQNDIPYAVLVYLREGNKAFYDKCEPYINRLYDELEANDCWIADTYTIDVMSTDGSGVHRLYLTAFLDAKSWVITGFNIAESNNSDSVRLALRNGILKYGIPKVIYVDNGREYLNHQLGGRGHRRKKGENPAEEPPPIFKRLGIEMRNANVCNAHAKTIERFFRIVKEQFAVLFKGFTGGNILEKPAGLKRRIKEGKLPMDYEVRETFEKWAVAYNNSAYGGTESCFRGMTRRQVWENTIQEIRQAVESDLNLMLMCTTLPQQIQRDGVKITVCGEEVWYWHPEQTIMNLKKKVYVRYDPADLRTARLYEAETDKFLFQWGLADKLMVDFLEEDQQKVADAQELTASAKKFIRQQAKGIIANLTPEQRISMLDMSIRQAEGESTEIRTPKNIIPVMVTDEPTELRTAVGAENMAIPIDVSRMNENARKRKENQ